MKANESLLDQLRALEERLTQPEVRRSPELLRQLLAEDFREFGGSGRVFDRRQIIEALQGQEPVQISLDGFQAQELAPEVVLLTYRGQYQRPNSTEVARSLRSSIWRLERGQWVMVFHQGTPA